MKTVDKNTFFEITRNFDYVPFTQSEGWCNSISDDESRFVFFVDDLEKPALACMGFVLKRLGLRMLQIQGECLLDGKKLDSRQIREFYKEISSSGFDMVEINSELPYNALYEIGIRQAGFLKPVGLFSTPLTILLDLKKPIEYDKNWQKNLRRTEKYQLAFVPVLSPAEKDIDDYMLIHSEMVGRKQFNDGLFKDGLKNLLNNNFSLFFVETAEKERIAGIITYAKNKSAISIFSATSLKGRQMSASYFLDDKLYHFYKEQGYFSFDCGRISPAAHKKNDIFLFKNGVKGEYLLYCGEWSWYRKQIYRPLMYFVKKYLLKRVEV
jgi:hypothetical protein